MKSRVTLKKALEYIPKDEFEELFRNYKITYQNIADKYNISVNLVKSLIKHWDLKWTEEEKKQKTVYFNHLTREKYGDDIEQKRLSTNLKRYGNKNPRIVTHPETYILTEEQKRAQISKLKQTNLNKFGKEYYSQTDEFKENMPKAYKETVLNKYGVTHHMKLDEFKTKTVNNGRHKYYYNNICFDSSWELAFYIYSLDNGCDIKRCSTPLIYYKNGEKHSYFPDFICDGDYKEIKGKQFINEDGQLVNPFNKELAIEKQQCMIDNNVEMLLEKDIQPILDYIKIKYGKDYLKQFMVK